MRIEKFKNIPGPNVYSHDPVLVMTLDLEDLAGKESYEVDGFVDRLLATLPGVEEHYCGLGRRGGFVERLRGGTWFGHIVEHVALELTDAVGISVNRGKTVDAGAPGKFLVAVTYKSEPGMRFLLGVAVELVQALVDNAPYPLEHKIQQARCIVQENAFGPSTQAIVNAAERRGIPWSRVDNKTSLIRLGYGVHGKYLEATISGETRAIGVDIASDKHLTKTLLERAALPVPRGIIVYTAEEAVAGMRELGAPVVVKPLDGNQGRGVSLNLNTPEEVMEAFETAHECSSSVIVEELLTGRDYRVLVVDGRMVAASEKIPAHVTGDGQHTIGELIEIANQDPRRGRSHSKPLSCIEVDKVMLAYLRRHGRTLETVPAAGETVLLRESANLSTGGEARDVTDSVHPQMALMCERAARIIGLDICGLDIVVPNIAAPPEGNGGIVEVNAAPGIRMHHFPSEGQPRDVASAIVRMLYPNGSNGRIPIISITGTNGKTTTARMIAHVIESSGKVVGYTSTDGITIGRKLVVDGDTTGPWSASVTLNDPSVEVAVLETARGGIVRSGLGYDWSDIGVITNIELDHIGQDGIERVEDIVKIKSLVAERVREGGTLILNAENKHTAGIADNPRISSVTRNVVLFSLDQNHPVIQRHLSRGGLAYVLHGDWIEQRRGNCARRIVRAAAIPVTLGGAADFQIANVMAAIAACRAYGLNFETITAALSSFDNTSQNAGRLNAYEYRDAVVVLDYGHNRHAIDAVGRLLTRLGADCTTAILGLPGDRSDELVREATRAAARHFRRIVLREDADRRGRAPGAMLDLMQAVLRFEFPHVEVHCVPDELDAFRWGLDHLRSREAMVAFCDHTPALTSHLLKIGGCALSDPGLLREALAARLPFPA